jgi:uncharacterized protein with GYD domain
MPKYMYRVSYTQSGIQGVMKEGGTSRKELVEKMAAQMGGSIEAFYFTFGESDVVVIADMPDDATAAAISMAVGASGAASIETTVLLEPSTVDKATGISTGYRPPGASS